MIIESCINKNGVWKPADDTHAVLVKGLVTVRNGDKVIFENKANKLVDVAACQMQALITSTGSTNYVNPISPTAMYLGSDQTTNTAHDTANLISPIGNAPGTAPNTLNKEYSNPLTGVYVFTCTATWNAGTVSGTVGEIAMYGTGNSTICPFANYPTTGGSTMLIARISVADGEMSAFEINNTKPLTVAWKVQYTCP